MLGGFKPFKLADACKQDVGNVGLVKVFALKFKR